MWRIRSVIQLLAISLFFACALFPLVEAVAVRTRMRRAVIILGVYQRYRQVVIDIKDAVAGYTLGNIIISVLATAATWIVLSILGVP